MVNECGDLEFPLFKCLNITNDWFNDLLMPNAILDPAI